MHFVKTLLVMTTVLAELSLFASHADENVQLGPRPFFLIDDMEESPLKTKPQQCSKGHSIKPNFQLVIVAPPYNFQEKPNNL
jgi:glycerophosphoryl diester phosphodiesterase